MTVDTRYTRQRSSSVPTTTNPSVKSIAENFTSTRSNAHVLGRLNPTASSRAIQHLATDLLDRASTTPTPATKEACDIVNTINLSFLYPFPRKHIYNDHSRGSLYSFQTRRTQSHVFDSHLGNFGPPATAAYCLGTEVRCREVQHA